MASVTVGESRVDHPNFRWAAYLESQRLDVFRTRAQAEYAARLLNSGEAVINVHAPTGSKIEVRY